MILLSLIRFDATCHRTERQSSLFDQIWRYRDKNFNSQTFNELGKFGNAIWAFQKSQFHISLWIEKNLEICTAPGHHFKIQMLNLWMSWENVCPNLTFTVENKMGNSHKRGWSHFKLNLNDWDIPFPKILRIYQWIGKNIFHCGKWNEPIKLIR